MNDFNQSRRRFMQGCAAMGTLGMGSTLGSLLASESAAAATGFDDYKALVCVFLFGGNDSFNMLVPTGDAYADYARARGNIAVAEDDIAPMCDGSVTTCNDKGGRYGLHPSLAAVGSNGGVQGLYSQRDLAFLANVGTLLEPIADADEYHGGHKAVPDYLFAHNHQQRQWQALHPGGPLSNSSGWGGRIADQISGLNQPSMVPDLSMNISLAGQQLLVLGNHTVPYAMSRKGVAKLNITGGSGVRGRTVREQVLNLMGSQRHLMAQRLAETKDYAYGINEELAGLYGGIELDNSLYPDQSKFAAQLQAITKMIKVSRDTLGFSRQIYFCSLGGWDTHAAQNTRHPALLSQLSQSLYAFHASLKSLGLRNDVTTFTTSEFGRTLNSNGDGSDHGWGGHQMVMGGAVRGRKIFGSMPQLAIGSELDAGRGRFIPTTSADQYAWTLANWFGARDPSAVLPNIGNFNRTDLGFMKV